MVPGIPDKHSFILTAGHDEGVEWMPITCCHLLSMLLKLTFHLRCGEIPNFCLRVLRAWNEFNWAHWEREISNTWVDMSLELISVGEFVVTIHDLSLFVTCNQILLVWAPAHGLNWVFVNISWVLVFKVKSVPLNDLSFIWARHYFLAIFHPLDLQKRSFMSVFALAHEVSARRFPVWIKSLSSSLLLWSINIDKWFICGIQILSIRIIWIDTRSVLCVKIIIVLLLIVVDLKIVGIYLLFVLRHSLCEHVWQLLVHVVVLVSIGLLVHHLWSSCFHYNDQR